MLFPTITFAVFFLLVFTGNWLLMPRPRLWKPFILLASLVFYGWWEWRFVLLLALSAVANQLFATAIERAAGAAARKWLLAAAVAVNLGVLGWFKYYGFFVTSVVNFLGMFRLNADLPLLRIVLPIGISFLTFRVLSYVVDVYRGKLRTSSLLDFAVYVAFFPYILAGPIARASEFLPQLAGPRDPRCIDTSRAFFLIFAGLAKKMLLADYLATHIVNGVFTTPGQYTSLETLLGIIGYSVQIYCDFSAYADIAIGVSLLLGFELPDNFNAPYTAISVQDFWRRWHMTLSRWLRDYLYIPLGGNRRGELRRNVNLLLTMALGGLWHGAGWTFVVWGVFHGVLLVGHRLWRRATDGSRLAAWRERWAYRIVATAVTFVLIALGWVMFQARDLGHGWAVIERMFGGAGGSARPAAGDLTWVWRVLVVVAAGHVLAGVRPIAALWEKISRNPWLAPLRGVAWAGAIAACFLLSAPPADFIYRMF